MTALVAAERLSYATPEGRVLAQGLTFAVEDGGGLAITGPNGIGKSTLLRVILGAHPKTSGDLRVSVASDQIAYLSQLHNREFHIPVTLRDIVRMFVQGRVDDARVLALGLLDKAQLRHPWNTASGGERQKTLLTCTLLQQPKLLILDEPYNHLDATGRRQLGDALRRFAAGGGGVVTVTHERLASADEWPLLKTLDLAAHSVRSTE